MRSRLIASQVIALVVMIATIATASFVGSGFDRTRPSVEELASAHRLNGDLQRYVSAGRRYVLSGDEFDHNQLRQQEAYLGASVATIAARVRESGGDATASELEAAIEAIEATVRRGAADRPASDAGKEEVLHFIGRLESELRSNRIAYDSAFDRLLSTPQDRLERDVSRMARFAGQTRWILIGAGAVAFAIAVLLTFLSLRELARMRHEPAPPPPRTEVIIKTELRTKLGELLERLQRIDRDILATYEASLVNEAAEIAKHVDQQLDGLFDLASVNASTAPLQKQRCRVDELVGRAMQPFEATTKHLGIRLRSECAPSMVYVDGDRIVRVISTLIEGAIKPPRPGAEVHVAAVPVDTGVRFAVTKLGTGALPDSVTAMFGTSAASTPAPAWHDKLDLHVCRSLVEAHDGRLGFEAAGPRTTCWFVIPNEPVLLRSS